jgi:hypothetical protein
MAIMMTGSRSEFRHGAAFDLIFGVYLSWLPVAGWNDGAPEPDPAR